MRSITIEEFKNLIDNCCETVPDFSEEDRITVDYVNEDGSVVAWEVFHNDGSVLQYKR